MILLAIPFFLLLWFGINWLLTKGVIYVAASLFNVHWEAKFWAVFLMVLLLGVIFGGTISRKS